MKSADLVVSPTWANLSEAIGRKYRAGEHFKAIHEMNIAINMAAGMVPYRGYRELLDRDLWHDDPGPKTIIDLGAGYGAMATCWPEGSTVYNVDLPEMLEIQKRYILQMMAPPLELIGQAPIDLLHGCEFHFVSIDKADEIPFDGAYLFSVWALTETTPETWRYYIERAPKLAGAYLLGYRGWESHVWPWEEMRDAFQTVRTFQVCSYEPNSYELLAVNR